MTKHVDDRMPPGDEQFAERFFREWLDVSNRGDWAAFAAMVHEDASIQDPLLPQPVTGRAAVVERARGQYLPFPDGRVEMLGSPLSALGGARLAYRWRFTGTHTLPIDPPGFAPTGARVTVEGMSLLDLDDGRVRSVELFFDTTAVARQVGAAPPAGSRLERVVVAAQRLRARRRKR